MRRELLEQQGYDVTYCSKHFETIF